jgi:hypothetical protein
MFNRIKELNISYSIYEPVMRTQIIGSILIVTAAVLLINPNSLNIKISFSSILLGILSMVLVKKTKNNNSLSEKIILILGIWIILLLVLTRNIGIDVLFISIFIGILVIKELTDELTTKYQKNVLNIFIFTFLLIFILIIGQKIISISSF